MFKKWILLTFITIFGLLACKPGTKDIPGPEDPGPGPGPGPAPKKELQISIDGDSTLEGTLNETVSADINVVFKDKELKNIKDIKETDEALYEQLVELIEDLKFDYIIDDEHRDKLNVRITDPVLGEDDTYTPPRVTIENTSNTAVKASITIKTAINTESNFSQFNDSVKIDTKFQNIYHLVIQNLSEGSPVKPNASLLVSANEVIGLRVAIKGSTGEGELGEEMLSVKVADDNVISVEKDENSNELVYNIKGITEGKMTSLSFTLNHPEMLDSEEFPINVSVGDVLVNNYTIQIKNSDGDRITEVELNEGKKEIVTTRIFLDGEDITSSFSQELSAVSSNDSIATITKQVSSRRNTELEYILTGLAEGTTEVVFSFNHPQTKEVVEEVISVTVNKEEEVIPGVYSIVIEDSEGVEITDIELYESTERILTPRILLDGEDVSSSFDTELLVTSSNESVATIAKKASSRRNTEREYILAGLVEGTAEITFSFNHPQTDEKVVETISVNVQHTDLYEIAILDAETNKKIEDSLDLNKGESKDILVVISADGKEVNIGDIQDLDVSTPPDSIITITKKENLYTITMSSSAATGNKGAVTVTFTHPQTQESISDILTVRVPSEGGASVDPLPEN